MNYGKQLSRIFFFAFLILFSIEDGFSQTYGLYFSGPEVSKDNRTGIDLSQFKTFSFNNGFTLSFEIMFRSLENHHYGFITRIIADGKGNIDLIYDNQQGNNKIVFVSGNHLSPIPFPVLKMKNEWTKIQLQFNPEKELCKISIADSVFQIPNLNFNAAEHVKIYFGAVPNGLFETSDVPAMNLKNIQILEDDEPDYEWLLNEKEGVFATDQVKKLKAKAYNPTWLSKKHNNWELVKSVKVSGDAAVTFNHVKDHLIIAGQNKLTSFNIADLTSSEIYCRNASLNIVTGVGNIFTDDSTGTVFSYDISSQKVSRFNFENAEWESILATNNNSEPYFHHNKIYSSRNKKLYIFGGFSTNSYQNKVFEFDLNSKIWTTLNTSGDSISPRYLSGIGMDTKAETIYLAGGFGSVSGNPILNAHYYYNLNTLNIGNRQLKKTLDYPSNIPNFSFANSLIVDEKDNSIYGLCFSAHKFKGELQLISSQIDKPEWIEYGDKIPFLFQKNQSYADLFYSDKLQKLIAVTIFKDENEESTVDIYSLHFPPNKSNQLIENERDHRKAWYWIILILLFDVVLFVGFYVRKKIGDKRRQKQSAKDAEKRKAMDASIQALADSEKPRSSIFLFGGFQVFDEKGEDISKLFTPLVKELFLIILLYPFKNGKGITSKRLTEMLWFDKPSAKAVNNRAVNMGKLKKILNLIGSSDLSNANGYWTFIFNEGHPMMYIDILEFQQIIQQENIEKANIQRLIKIIQKGNLLTFLAYDWLDEIKERISSHLIDLFIEYLESSVPEGDSELIIKIADCILIFDPINEQAIAFKCKALISIGKHGVAQKTFQKFVTEYEQLYAIPFNKSLREIVEF